ncbi:MAG: hypothetical protein ACK5GN_11740, partial [Pseudomonadota bacterium]
VTKSTLPFGWYFITDLRLGYTDTTYIIENLVKVLRGHVGRKSSRATDKKKLTWRLLRDLRLFNDMKLLARHTHSGIRARLATRSGPLVEIEQLADQARKLVIAESLDSFAQVANDAGSNSLTLWPIHHDLEKDTFVFSLRSPRQP